MPDSNIEAQIEDAIAHPERYAGAQASELPPGTVLPMYFPNNKLVIPLGWCICAGQKIEDPASPFLNLNVPNLLDQRFPMGTKVAETYGKSGGNNELAPEGNHSHKYTIRKAGTRQNSPDGFQAEGPQCRVVTLDTTADGQHNHGGDNRPRWFGLLYIFKYK